MTDRVLHLTMARAAADEALLRMVTDGVMTADAAHAMAGAGFTAATRILSELRASDIGPHCITTAFEAELDRARTGRDQRLINSTEFTLAVWHGMQEDFAAWLESNEGAQTT